MSSQKCPCDSDGFGLKPSNLERRINQFEMERGKKKSARASGTSPMTTSENLSELPAAVPLSLLGHSGNKRWKSPTEF